MGFITPNIQKLAKGNDVDGLVKCLSHRKADIRLKALSALIQKVAGSTAIMESIRKLLSDKEPKVRIGASIRLAQLGLRDIMDDLKYSIVNGTKSEKIDVLRALADHYLARDESVSNLLVMAINDKTALVQIEAMKTMGQMKDTTSVIHLAEMLHDRRHAMRIESVNALGSIGTPPAVDLVIGSLMDKHPDVRKAARVSLEGIGSERSQKAINDAPFMLLVKRMNSSVAIKTDTIKHIAKQKINEGLPLLRKACSDEYKNVRIEAIRAIGTMKDKGSLSVLARCGDDPYFDVRLEMVKSLQRLVTRESLLIVEKRIKDFNYNVREEAKNVYYFLLDRLEKLEKRDENVE